MSYYCALCEVSFTCQNDFEKHLVWVEHIEKINVEKEKHTFKSWGNLDNTGKSLSEAHVFASTNPQFDNRLFNENSKLRKCQEHIIYTNCFCFDIQNNLPTQHFLTCS